MATQTLRQVNFTDMHLQGRKLVKKLKSEFSWLNKKRKLGNSTVNLYENLDALVRIEHFMSYVQEKVNHLHSKKKETFFLSFLAQAPSMLASITNIRLI